MKTFFFLLIFSFFSYHQTHAQSSKKDLETSIDSFYSAIISQDKTVLDKLTANELSFGHSSGLVENKSAFIQAVLSGPVKFNAIKMDDQSISLVDNLAIVRHLITIKEVKDGIPVDLKLGVLMIWKLQADLWQLFARQGYKLP
jgi:hypothetical protein